MEHAGLTLALALAAGVVAQSLARHARLPGIVLLLFAGAALGPDVLGWVDPRSLGRGLFEIVDLGVAVILFEGGLNLDFGRLRREQEAIRRLVTIGALVTLAGGALAARALLGWSFERALLFGSLIVVTGPTVVTPLVRELRLRPRVATVLDAEAVLIDPIGVILAVLVLEVVLAPGAETLAAGARGFVFTVGFGVVAGTAVGLLLGYALRLKHVVPEGFENIFTLGIVLLLFAGANALVPQSGIAAVAVAGVWVGNLRTRVDRDLREFKDQLTVLLIGLLFVLLAADVRLEDVRALGLGGIAVVAVLVLAVRPLNVWVSMTGTELPWQERAFCSWMAPRGIVAAAVASLTAGIMESRGIPGGAELRALVFLTIATTVVLAGVTGRPVAALLGLRLPGRDAVAILGAQGLGITLAEALREADVPVVFLDSNPQHCRHAEEAGFPVVFGNALEERTLQRARFERVGVAVGLTPNETLNSLFVAQAVDLFAVPAAYVALASSDTGVTPEVVERHQAEPLFEGPHDVERWEVRSRHGEVDVEQLVRCDEQGAPAELEAPTNDERFVILALRRGSRLLPMTPSLSPRAGDEAIVAMHAPERESALELLRNCGWELPAERPAEA